MAITVIYILSTIVFCVAALIVPFAFIPLVRVYKAVTHEILLAPTHPALLMPVILGTTLLLHLTRYVWAHWAIEPGWLFPTIIAALHFLFGGMPGANRANQAQAYGVVLGVLVYGLSRLLVG